MREFQIFDGTVAQLPVRAAAGERANDTNKHLPSVAALTAAGRLNFHLDMYTTHIKKSRAAAKHVCRVQTLHWHC